MFDDNGQAIANRRNKSCYGDRECCTIDAILGGLIKVALVNHAERQIL
jgi:hypothetical protein